MHLKRPKQYLNHGSEPARLRKQIELNITTQEALDAFLLQLPPLMRPMALERARPYLKFTPREDMLEEVPAGNPEG